jgi:site-specific recombinase XerD
LRRPVDLRLLVSRLGSIKEPLTKVHPDGLEKKIGGHMEENKLSVISYQLSVENEWLRAFASHLEEKGRSECTIRAYKQDLRSFSAWFEEQNGCTFEPGLLTGVDIRAYKNWAIEERRLKPASFNRRLNCLRALIRWAMSIGYLNYDPSKDIKLYDEEELPPRWLTKQEFNRFMRTVEVAVNSAGSPAFHAQAVRDWAMINLMAYAGLRVSEVAGLLMSDMILGARSGKVVVWSGKGTKKREIPLCNEARIAVSAWLEIRGNRLGKLFTAKGSNNGVSMREIQNRVTEFSRSSGVDCTSHELRHTFAKRLSDAGVQLTVIQKLLGHSRPDTTTRYVKPGWEDFEKAVEKL